MMAAGSKPGYKKVDPATLRQLTVQHTGSRAIKYVTYLGLGYGDQPGGRPSRLVARIHWPLAGDYEVECTEGFVLGLKNQSQRGLGWKLTYSDLCFVQREREREIERRKLINEERCQSEQDA
jgi:hypothetical protein